MIVTWLLVAIALVAAGNAAGEQNSDNLSLPGTGSTRAQNLLKDRLPDQAYGTNPIVRQARAGKLSESNNSKAVDDAVKLLKRRSISRGTSGSPTTGPRGLRSSSSSRATA